MFFIPCSHIFSICCLKINAYGFWLACFFKKTACSFHFRVPPFHNGFVIPPGSFSDDHSCEVIQHGPLIFGRENNGIEAVSAAAQLLVNATLQMTFALWFGAERKYGNTARAHNSDKFTKAEKRRAVTQSMGGRRSEASHFNLWRGI